MAISILFAGCNKIEDLYQEPQDQSSSLFPDGITVPQDFNWATSNEIDVKISVDDKYEGKFDYLIELFSSDPFFSKDAPLLGAGLAKAGTDYIDKISIPAGLQYIYVKQTDPKGTPSLTMLKVTGNLLIQSSAINTGSSRASVAGRMNIAGQAKVMAAAERSNTTTISIPPSAILLSGSGDVSLKSNMSYLIKENSTFTGNILANNGSTNAYVYVEGTWNAPNNNLDIGASNTIYVLEKGVVKLAGITQNTQGGLENLGDIALGNLTITNDVVFKNFGVMSVDKATISNGSLFNQGTANINLMKSTTASSLIQNQGKLTVNSANLTNATLDASCHTEIKTFTNNGAKVRIASGALLTLETLSSKGTTYSLEGAAILHVDKSAHFADSKSTMEGTGVNAALLRFKKVEITGWEALNYTGNLQIACSDHTPNGQWDRKFTISAPASIVPWDKATLEIAPTTCNAGGNNDSSEGNNPDNQTPPEVALEPYTFAFEDNWPKKGDYDMNDFGVELKIIKTQDAQNKVVKVQLSGKITSVGAARRLAAGIQLDGILAENIKSVKYSRSDLLGQAFSLGSNGVEGNQKFAVLGLVGDAHRAFGVSQVEFISTQNGSFPPVEFEITVEFNSPLESFTQKVLNPFIFTDAQNSAGRNEIHQVGYSATDKMNKSIVQKAVSEGDITASDIFKTKIGEPWAISVPTSFIFPLEGRDISKHYSTFIDWAKSGGTINPNWYDFFQK